MATFGRVILLVAIAGVCALLQVLISGPVEPTSLSDEWSISVDELGNLDSFLLIDARPEDAFIKDPHVDAVHLTEDDWDTGLGILLNLWDPETILVVYCDGMQCANSREVAARLRSELGVEEVFWLEGGWEALKEVRK